jgi:MFS family permease
MSRAPTDTSFAPGGSWLNRNIAAMGATSFLSDACYEMVLAVLPGFFTVLHLPALALGFIEATADALASFVKLGSGWWSDRLQARKWLVVAGYALTGTALSLCAWAASWPLILLARCLAWLGKGIRSPARSAIMAASVSEADRGKAFGFHRASDTLGAIVGPVLGMALLAWLHPWFPNEPDRPYRWLFLASLVPGIASAVVFAVFVVEPAIRNLKVQSLRASLGALPGNYLRSLWGIGCFGAGDFSHTLLGFVVLAVLTPEWGPVAATAWMTGLYAFKNLFGALAAYPLGALSDRLGRRAVLVAGYAVGTLTMAGFAAVLAWSIPSAALLGILYALAGTYLAAEETLENALVADLVPDPHLHGTAYGVLNTVNGMGDFVSSIMLGALWLIHPMVGFIYAAVMMGTGTLLLAWLVRSPAPLRTHG